MSKFLTPRAGNLPAERDAYSITISSHRALAAKRRNGPAQVLAKAYQQIVVFNPVLFRELFSQGKLGLVRILGSVIAPAIRNAMDMGVNTDARFLVSKRNHKICSFPTNALEFQ